MEPFVRLRGIAAPLPMINVDTDMIIPKQFLKTVKRTGLGAHLFEEMRFDRESGAEIPEFVLNRPPYREAEILLAGENFGCGSSREHAPWALRDFGIRCVIAPSFADIFHANCFKNGMLPVILPKETVEALMQDARAAETAVLSVDLETREIRRTGNEHAPIPFEVDEFRRDCLLEGHDDISLTLVHAPEIGRFEEAHRANCPWM